MFIYFYSHKINSFMTTATNENQHILDIISKNISSNTALNINNTCIINAKVTVRNTRLFEFNIKCPHSDKYWTGNNNKRKTTHAVEAFWRYVTQRTFENKSHTRLFLIIIHIVSLNHIFKHEPHGGFMVINHKVDFWG